MGRGGIFKQLSKALIERCLNTEMDNYLEKEKIEKPEAKNRSNGKSKKTIKGEFRSAETTVLQDRNSKFEPKPPYQFDRSPLEQQRPGQRWSRE
jgi:putative transposase